jgi:circadian clock protein KaiB
MVTGGRITVQGSISTNGPPHSALIVHLRLYVSGNAPNSVAAIANAKAICAEHFASRHDLEIVDLLMEPLRALPDGIIVTPTLIKLLPLPVLRIVGNLSDRHQVLLALAGA